MAKDTPPDYWVIRDTREQQGYRFKPYNKCKGYIEQKLDTGDYSLKGLEDKICIERKASPTEVAINLGKDKTRFMAEIERMKDFEHKYIILEFSMEDLMKFPEGSNIPAYQKKKIKVNGKYMLRMFMEFEVFDDINVIFCGNAYNGFLYVSSLFKRLNEKYSVGRVS